MKLACDTCGNPIGQVELEDLSVPITPTMFQSLMPERGVPAPFVPGLEWHQLHCRICKHRAFHSDDRITVIDDKGAKTIIEIGKIDNDRKTREANQAEIDAFEDEPEFKCACGKVYKHYPSLLRHQKGCEWAK